MKIILIIFMFSFTKLTANNEGTAYDYEFKGLRNITKLSKYKGKVIVVVNAASRCGCPQYDGLQLLWSNYKNKDLVVLGVPTNNFRQEPDQIKKLKIL